MCKKFRFPIDAGLAQRWTVALRRLDPVSKKLWQPTKHSRVCSDHFLDDDYISKSKISMLKKGVVAYFITTGATASVQADILKHVFNLLVEINVIPVSLTLDGCATNLSTLRQLGCSLDPFDLKPYFTFEESPFGRIYAILDACHMIKLIRNLFAKVKVLRICDQEVKWQLHATSELRHSKDEGMNCL